MHFRQLNEQLEQFLYEGVNDLIKFYPLLKEQDIKRASESDPTYKGGDKVGSYTRWILKLLNNAQKNIKNEKDYQRLSQDPEFKKPLVKSPILPEIKEEDFYKVKDYLTVYHNFKKQINKPLDHITDLPELAQLIQPYEDKKADLSLTQIKKQEKLAGAEKVFENNNWVVIVPKTLQASKLYGANTKWCTTGQTYFKEYTRKGPLYILINKETKEKFQFHFQTNSFMNAVDQVIDVFEVVIDPELKTFLLKENNNESERFIFDLLRDDAPEDIKKTLIQGHDSRIEKLKNPSEELIQIAIHQNPKWIKKYPPQSEDVKLNLIKDNPMVIGFMDNPSEELQLEAVGGNKRVLRYIKNPTQKVIELANNKRF